MLGLTSPRKLLKGLLKAVVAVAAAVALSWLLLTLFGYNAKEAIISLYNASFENLRVLGTMLNRASPLIFTGIAVAIAYRGSVFNIGADGQFLAGAIVSTWIGVTFVSLPGPLLVSLIVLGGALGGALWAFIPGLLKAKNGISEVITTIMFNYIALQMVGFLVRGPLRDTSQAEPQSFAVAQQAHLPYLFTGTRLHPGFFVAVVMAVLSFIVLFKTYFGYEIRAVGFNSVASRYAGIHVNRTVVGTMLVSGALAGMGGAFEVAGATHFLYENISGGYGYTAIAVSVLAGNNPLGVVFSALLFGFLTTGSTAMQRNIGISSSFADVVQGIIIIFVAVAAVRGTRAKLGKKAMGTSVRKTGGK